MGHTSLACISIELFSVPLRQSTIVVSLLNKVHSAWGMHFTTVFLFFFLNFWWRQLAAGRSLNSASCRGSWGECSCPRSATAIHSVAVEHLTFRLGGGHLTTELLPPPTTELLPLLLWPFEGVQGISTYIVCLLYSAVNVENCIIGSGGQFRVTKKGSCWSKLFSSSNSSRSAIFWKRNGWGREF